MEDFRLSDIEVININEIKDYYDTPGWSEVQEIINKLNQCFNNEQKNFTYICYYLHELSNLL